MNEVLRDYIRRGWSIIPIIPRDKRPLVRWEDFQTRLPSEPEVSAWFRAWPDAGVAIVTGAISRVVVVDVDLQHDGESALNHIESLYGRLPKTLECRTGGGGRHLYFSHSGGLVRNRVGLLPGIDLRGDGGYVVAPPSRHATGALYAWADDAGPNYAALAPLPGWAVRHGIEQLPRVGRPIDHWRELVRKGVLAGERNNTIASLAGHLLRRGVDDAVVMELLLCWNRMRCRPPLEDAEVAAVVASITRVHPAMNGELDQTLACDQWPAEARHRPSLRIWLLVRRVPPPQPQPLIIEPGLFRLHEILGWIAIVAGAAVFVAALTVPVDDPALLLVPAVLLRAGWLIFDSDRHRARVPAESASMNKLRPLNKLRSPGYSVRGGVVANRPL
jgi:hypothetical protein